jgi:HK97 gp10 family phage protein
MLTVKSKFTPRNGLGQFATVVVSPAVAAAVQESCELVQGIAKALCPIDTGALNDSITIDPLDDTGSTIIGSVGPHMPYASYVEYGTGQRGDPSAPYGHVESWPGMKAQPYMRPSVDEAKGQIKDIFVRNVGAPFE